MGGTRRRMFGAFGGWLGIGLVVLAVAIGFGSRFAGRKGAELDAHGMTVAAVLTGVETRRERVSGAGADAEYKLRTTFDFAFDAGPHGRIEGQRKRDGGNTSLGGAREVGDRFDLRYLKTDPSVYEIGVGTAARSGKIMGGVAVVLLVVGLGAVGWALSRSAKARGLPGRAAPLRAVVKAGPVQTAKGADRPMPVHWEEPDGQRGRSLSRMTLAAGRPALGSEITVYREGRLSLWARDLGEG
ncbi:hypothetical protein IV417_01640 [Alphaproteobacteria bacterium KMM 3653]|uniref:DUF3592 domain-containing protein n=1 Tax=Harenicola maris TaxID=2841044 RepID=A0AAP2CPF8_9RHOB|nr:hypothetical protein [Harenicola maris]